MIPRYYSMRYRSLRSLTLIAAILLLAAHGIPTIGVSWGYGQVEDMQKAGAAAIADTPERLLELLNQ